MVPTNSPSFNHYGKVDPHNASADNVLPGARCLPAGPTSSDQTRNTKRRVVIIGLLSILLVLVICVAIAVPLIRNKNDSKEQSGQNSAKNVNTLCQSTLYPEVCQQTLTDNGLDNTTSDPQQLVNRSILVAFNSVTQLSDTVDTLVANETDANVAAALADCQSLLEDALDNLNITRESLSSLSLADLQTQFDDLVTFMSTALTDKTTCLDGFEELANGTAKNMLSQTEPLVDKYLSIALSLVSSFTTVGSDLSHWQNALTNRGLRERHLLEGSDEVLEYPKWFDSAANRRLLASNDFAVDVVVSGDGTAHFKTIQAAVNAAPTKSKKRHVIYITEGTYQEQVKVHKNKTYVMFVGAGAEKTVITGKLNVQMPGVTTFLSATLIVAGANFIGRDFTVRNEAGPEKHQAVGMRVSADRAAFYHVTFEGYQDTLYAHSQRQFYKECTVAGTVDFIFGNGAVVLQTCKLLVRLPSPGQQNTLTAQGRTDPSQNTGLAFYDCTVDGIPELQRRKATVASFLGRPWKLYSRTVYIRTYLGDIISPTGWLIWVGNWALKTCYYAEYQNVGPGSDTHQRVGWSHQIMSASDANKFSANKFIGANRWLPATNIPYDSTTL